MDSGVSLFFSCIIGLLGCRIILEGHVFVFLPFLWFLIGRFPFPQFFVKETNYIGHHPTHLVPAASFPSATTTSTPPAISFQYWIPSFSNYIYFRDCAPSTKFDFYLFFRFQLHSFWRIASFSFLSFFRDRLWKNLGLKPF